MSDLKPYYKFETGSLSGWAPAAEIYTEYTTQAACAVWD